MAFMGQIIKSGFLENPAIVNIKGVDMRIRGNGCAANLCVNGLIPGARLVKELENIWDALSTETVHPVDLIYGI